MIEQLIRKNCHTGENDVIDPKTVLEAVRDPHTGETLDTILEKNNHIYLSFKENSKTLTRLQIPEVLRRRGLWITYTSCRGESITERYNSDNFSDKSWGDSKNWVSNDTIVRSIIKDLLGLDDSTLKDGKINNFSEMVEFLKGFTEDDNLRDIINNINQTVEVEGITDDELENILIY